MNTIWILIVLVVGYHDSNSQIAVEFNSKEACVQAAEVYRASARVNNYEYRELKVVARCFAKGEKK